MLSTSGHIAALVNPTTNTKASFQVNEYNPSSPEEWLASATTEQGSWWPDYIAWLRQRTGDEKPAPTQLGGGGLDPIEAAPGTYVLER